MTVFAAEIIAVGDELLAGDIVNRNAATIAKELATIGIPVDRQITVGNSVEVIAQVLADAAKRVPVVIVTGGLGPTQDDLTREGIALAAGVQLKTDVRLQAHLLERLAARGRDVPSMNLRQAQLPVGSMPIPNPVGTAPGIERELAAATVFALPGVPAEMTAMLRETVVPRIQAKMPAPQAVSVQIVRTSGMWESQVAELMAPEVARTQAAGGPVIAFLASGGQTRVKVTGIAPTKAEADALVDPVIAYALRVLGEAAYGGADDSLPAAVVAALRAAGETVAVAESLTGGLLAGALTDIPGASAVFRGSVTAYATELKHDLLGVPQEVLNLHGAVSAETAKGMAAGVRAALGATWGIATTGVAGPDTQEEKPAGTVHVAVEGPGYARAAALKLPGERSLVRSVTVTHALDLLRRALAERERGGTFEAARSSDEQRSV